MSASVGVGLLGEERGGGHDLPRLAVAALDDVDLGPGALDGMGPVGGEALDGGDRPGADRRDRGDAGPDGLAVEVDGAGAALGHPAAVLGAGVAEDVPQDPQQRHVGRCVDLALLAVDDELHRAGPPWPKGREPWSRTAPSTSEKCSIRGPSHESYAGVGDRGEGRVAGSPARSLCGRRGSRTAGPGRGNRSRRATQRNPWQTCQELSLLEQAAARIRALLSADTDQALVRARGSGEMLVAGMRLAFVTVFGLLVLLNLSPGTRGAEIGLVLGAIVVRLAPAPRGGED